MTTRRQLLAGIGTGVTTALAGCVFRDGPAADDETIDPSTFDGEIPAITVPLSPLPVSLPETTVDRHRTRARELFDSVPSDPSIPNGAVAARLQREREHVRERLEEGSEAAETIDVLDDWRNARGDAANLVGTYRAATGSDDGDRVTRRRRQVRTALGEFVADLEYRAGDPVEAVLVYATIETTLGSVRRRVRPMDPYPTSPLSAVERAGDAVEAVEDAVAGLADAQVVHETYLSERDGPDEHWSQLIDASRVLDMATHRTREPIEAYVEEYDPESVFDRDVGPLAASLYRSASRRVASGEGNVREYRRRGHGEYATATLEATRNLVDIAVLRSVANEIEAGAFDREVTAASIEAAAERARSAVDALAGSIHPHLAVAIARPAIWAYENGARAVGERYFDPHDAEASFRHATMFARVAPEAADYLVARFDAGVGSST